MRAGASLDNARISGALLMGGLRALGSGPAADQVWLFLRLAPCHRTRCASWHWATPGSHAGRGIPPLGTSRVDSLNYGTFLPILSFKPCPALPMMV
jgi:hypothetical protein